MIRGVDVVTIYPPTPAQFAVIVTLPDAQAGLAELLLEVFGPRRWPRMN